MAEVYLPAVQSVQELAPEAEYEPGAHELQLVEPWLAWYSPDEHSLQNSFPDVPVEKVPARQLMQVDDSVAPITSENVPAAHAEHDIAPTVAPYLPTGQ